MSTSAQVRPEVIEDIVNNFHFQAFEDLFPKGLDSPISSWVRMGAPIGEAEFHGFLKLGPTKHTHSRKGFQSGMAALLFIRSKKGIKLTEKQDILMNAHISEIPFLLLLIFDAKEKRQAVVTPRVQSGSINVIASLLDQSTVEWLARAWPKITTPTNKTQVAQEAVKTNQSSSTN